MRYGSGAGCKAPGRKIHCGGVDRHNPADHALGGARGGLSTKIVAAAGRAPEYAHEYSEHTLDDIQRFRYLYVGLAPQTVTVIGDTGAKYDEGRLRIEVASLKPPVC
jgi:hypothetical protein